MSRMSAFLLAAFFGINLALVFIGRGSIGQLAALSCTSFIGLICICTGGLVLLIGGRSSPTRRRFAIRAIALGFVLESCLLSWPLGFLVSRSDIEQARNFCDRVRPELERHRDKTGGYPKRLSELPNIGPLPRLLQENSYRSDGAEYSFSILDPSDFLGGVDFDSRSGVWSEWD